ncbi:winged helix-turn-helix domain-containing protein [Streptomyces sp. NBC_00669]|uniref:ArsR/SmtB family transcription factor n=1 Tax=Streptomyces sp. NBC_00669 TaxID=2976011 RepID=UPI002E3172C9|nr:winged helix-turn-helix domain-containing protein [Streptomyces sp. NBC_00669]
MLRVHFTAGDVARLRVAPAGPLTECMVALSTAQLPCRTPLLGGWRARVRDRLPPDARTLALAWAEPRRALDLFTALGADAELDEGIADLLAGPRRLREELRLYPPKFLERQPDWLMSGIGGGGASAARVSGALNSAFSTAIGPYWDRLHSALSGQLASYGRAMASGGVDALFARLGPWLRWSPPVLEIAAEPAWSTRDVRLDGQGLALVPSFFCDTPQMFRPTEGGEAVLIHPVPLESSDVARVLAPPPSARRSALAALLGHTRAAVLEAVDDGTTTGELARRLAISASSASKHATVLREAGLLTSRREREHVWHTLTPAAVHLLNSVPGAGA